MDWVNPLQKINNKVKFQLFGKVYDNLLHLYALIPQFDQAKDGALS